MGIRSGRRVRYDNRTGHIVEVRMSRHARPLDKYVVQFANPELSEVFWDIELTLISAGISDASLPGSGLD